MIVADASAVVDSLLLDGEARAAFSGGRVAVPHLADAEVVAALRSHVHRRELSADKAQAAVHSWATFACDRLPVTRLLERIWELRHNVSPYDAQYVALAETLDCELLTRDERLARATGPRCGFTVLRG